VGPERHRQRALRRVGAAIVGAVGLLAPVAVGGSVASTDTRSSTDVFADRLEVRVPALMERYEVPGVSIALVRDGRVAWSSAYGYADDVRRRPLTVDAIFRAESISKPVTAWGVLQLVEQGRLGLDDSVEDHLTNWDLPSSAFSREEVTIRRLLSHSGGLPLGSIGVQFEPGGQAPSLADSLSREARLVREPGAAFHYSNPGFDLLELLIEDVTGSDFAEHMEREVLGPLGMHDSSFSWSDEAEHRIASGHDTRGEVVAPYVYASKASGGLLATIDDLGRFVAAGMPDQTPGRPQVLSEESIRSLYSPTADMTGIYRAVSDGHGLGYFLETLPGGQQAVFYGGQGNGWLTHMHAVPEVGDGIVILTNSQRSWPLIAHVSSDWAQWRGFTSVGMSRIITATMALWTLIGLLGVVALGQSGRLARGLTSARRHFAPLSPAARPGRLTAGVGAVGLMAVLVWATGQDYLFVTSVFPIASIWLGIVLGFAALVLALTALLPRTPRRITDRPTRRDAKRRSTAISPRGAVSQMDTLPGHRKGGGAAGQVRRRGTCDEQGGRQAPDDEPGQQANVALVVGPDGRWPASAPQAVRAPGPRFGTRRRARKFDPGDRSYGVRGWRRP